MVALIALLAAAIGARDPEPVRAQGVSGDCITIPVDSGGRALCTFLDQPAVDLGDLVASLGGSEDSGIWIQAWGGRGADAPDAYASDGGAGGAGGYAQTYYDRLSSFEEALGTGAPTLYPYYGGNAITNTGNTAGGSGGASTLVASTNVTAGVADAYIPCILADRAFTQDGDLVDVPNYSGEGPSCPRQSVVLLAGGGGGGGGTCGPCHDGRAGGGGGTAIATSVTAVGPGADGDSQYPKRAGIGGFNGVGGRNHKYPEGNAGDGIGGVGGPYSKSDAASETIGGYLRTSFVGAGINGSGGRGYSFGDNDGGGGGGGFGGGSGGGGGGAGGGSGNQGASGGGGGGSYAYKGDAPPGQLLATGAPSATQGAIRVVIDGVPPPAKPLAACAIAQHGSEAAETLRGTSGGDDIYGYGGEDSIIAGAGDDCAHAGGGDDDVRGGRGSDRIRALGGHDSLRGGRGADKINAEGGRHEVHGGRGADRIRARDRKRDSLHCGRGHDEVWVDARDRVGPGCERVHGKRG